jgi:hypothetical protein
MGVVLLEVARPHAAVERTGRFIAVAGAELGIADWKLPPRAQPLVEDLHVARTRHRLAALFKQRAPATRNPSSPVANVPTCSRASPSNSCPPKAKVTRSNRVGGASLEVECARCKTGASLPLDAIRRPRDTPLWKLEASLKCRSCRTPRYAPPARMIKLTEARQTTPYKWVQHRLKNRFSSVLSNGFSR